MTRRSLNEVQDDYNKLVEERRRTLIPLLPRLRVQLAETPRWRWYRRRRLARLISSLERPIYA